MDIINLSNINGLNIDDNTDNNFVIELNDNKSSKKKQKRKVSSSLVNDNTSINNFIYDINKIKNLVKELDISKILILNSEFNNEIQLLGLLIHYEYIKIYKCNYPNCKVMKTWNRKPIQLLVSRKNKINNDLRVENLELLCPNCYVLSNGINIFTKQIETVQIYCIYCGYNLSNFSSKYKEKKMCKSCEKKLIYNFQDNINTEYINSILTKETTELISTPINLNSNKTKYSKNKSNTHKSNSLNTIPLNLEINLSLEDILNK